MTVYAVEDVVKPWTGQQHPDAIRLVEPSPQAHGMHPLNTPLSVMQNKKWLLIFSGAFVGAWSDLQCPGPGSVDATLTLSHCSFPDKPMQAH